MQGIAKRRPALSAAGSGHVLGPGRLATADAYTVADAAAVAAPVRSGAGTRAGRVGRLPVNLPVDLCGGNPGEYRSDGRHPHAAGHPDVQPAALFHGWTPGGAPDAPAAPHREIPGGRAAAE